MISWVKAAQLRIERVPAPHPPFCCASIVSPYATRREAPLSIDLVKLTAHAFDRGEVRVATDAADLLSREEELRSLPAPVLVDATGFAESVFARGVAAAEYLAARGTDTVLAVSSASTIPLPGIGRSVAVIETWPPDIAEIEAAFSRARGLEWGVFVPVIFPATTDLALLTRIADAAKEAGARFLSCAAIELDAPARRGVAELLGDALDEESYESMFHDDVDVITLATERHIAALACEREMDDYVPPVEAGQRDNWSAASHLARVGSRMVRMDEDVEAGWSCIRSAAALAQLEKPLERIAQAADVSIVKSIEPAAADALREWLREGASALGRAVDGKWRLRRDYAVD